MIEEEQPLDEAALFLENQDKIYGKNVDIKQVAQPAPVTSLGNALTPMLESTIGGPNDSLWKNIPLENLPSKGLFYPADSEITIKAATVAEIRHWSTIDDSDILDIDDKLNYVIEKCSRFKIKGGTSWLSWRDISELDRVAIIFLIQELTFPADQNSLFSEFECTESCKGSVKWKDSVKIKSSMLTFIDLPEEVMKYYSAEYKCFEVKSEKLNETFYLYMPTIGAIERLRARIAEARSKNRKPDMAFLSIAAYLIQDWQSFTQQEYYNLINNSYAWHINKFTFIKKFTELIENARESVVNTVCPNCGNKVTSPLFTQSSFTFRDFFLISGGLDELI
jgi:hypothetical protein